MDTEKHVAPLIPFVLLLCKTCDKTSFAAKNSKQTVRIVFIVNCHFCFDNSFKLQLTTWANPVLLKSSMAAE